MPRVASTPAPVPAGPVRLEHPRVYTCAACRTHVTTHDNIISKAFQGRHGRAFLLTSAVNLDVGEKEDRVLMTGLHTVADIFCSHCSTRLGWKYVEAFEPRCASTGPGARWEGASGGLGGERQEWMLSGQRVPTAWSRREWGAGGGAPRGATHTHPLFRTV